MLGDLPPEFRRRAVQLVREWAKPLAEVAEDLWLSESCLRVWLAQADVDERGSTTALTSKGKKEPVELRRDRCRLERASSVSRFSTRMSAR